MPENTINIFLVFSPTDSKKITKGCTKCESILYGYIYSHFKNSHTIHLTTLTRPDNELAYLVFS